LGSVGLQRIELDDVPRVADCNEHEVLVVWRPLEVLTLEPALALACRNGLSRQDAFDFEEAGAVRTHDVELAVVGRQRTDPIGNHAPSGDHLNSVMASSAPSGPLTLTWSFPSGRTV